MDQNQKKCLVCERSSQEIPLLGLTYRDQQFWICPEHLPVLIHHPGTLIGKVPGAEHLTPHEG